MRLFRSLLFQAALWAILPLLAITAVSVISIYGHQRAERELVAERVARLAYITASSLANQLEDNTRVLRALAETEALRAGALQPLDSASDPKTWRSAFDLGVLLLSTDGRTVVRLGDAAKWAALDELQALRSRVRTESAPVLSLQLPDGGGQVVTLLAVAAPDGETLVGGFSPTSLGIDHFLSDLQLGARGTGYIVDANGVVLHEQPGESLARPTQLPGFADASAGRSGAIFYEDAGESWSVGYASVPSGRWAVIIRESWADAVGPMAQFSVLSPILVIIAALVSLIAVYLILEYVIRPLRRLGRMADQVAWGEFAAVEQPLGGVQEIRDLQSTLQHMVDQIRRYQASMQSYVTAVTQGQEEERKRLARELHDDTAQSLIGLVQRIKLARRDLKRDPARADERLAELEQLSTAAWQDVRRFSEALRPAYLEQFGLEPALSTLTQQVGAAADVPKVSFAVEGVVRRLRADVELALFRIVQEALNNTGQHASASRVDVTLRYDEESVTVTVADDGRGFDAPTFPGALAEVGHFGLAGIRERALLVGGRLVIDSAPGRGTRLEVAVPSAAPDPPAPGSSAKA